MLRSRNRGWRKFRRIKLSWRIEEVHDTPALPHADTHGKTERAALSKTQSPISPPNLVFTNRSQIIPAVSEFSQATIANRRAISI
jgi:hypothetical protein